MNMHLFLAQLTLQLRTVQTISFIPGEGHLLNSLNHSKEQEKPTDGKFPLDGFQVNLRVSGNRFSRNIRLYFWSKTFKPYFLQDLLWILNFFILQFTEYFKIIFFLLLQWKPFLLSADFKESHKCHHKKQIPKAASIHTSRQVSKSCYKLYDKIC